jgi:pimeloyl-ACP methyl ester carboxylesterase
MAHQLELRSIPAARPLGDWDPISAELLGTQVYLARGERWQHRVIECGTGGEPLILIHGIGGHAEAYSRNWHNLARAGFHVYAIDALYHGYTSKHPQVPFAERTARQADAVADLVRALGHDYVHVEGESMGADIAYEFGLRHPGMARKLILNTGFPAVNDPGQLAGRPVGGPATGGLSDLMRLSHESVTSGSVDIMRRRMEWLVAKPERMTDEMVRLRLRLYGDPEINQAMRYVYRMGEALTPPPRREEAEIQQMKCPALVLWTEHNPGQDLDYGRYASTLLADGTFYGMSDAGHWPQWEKPEEHDQVVAEFILGS